jgi:hypothetical protein
MSSVIIYSILNNSSVAAIIAVILGAYIAAWQYRKQKEIDRDNEIKKDIISSVIHLQGSVSSVILILNRVANSYEQKPQEKTDREFFEDSLRYELPRLSVLLNDQIPYFDAEIQSKLDNYFLDNKIVKESYDNLKRELKRWHDPIVKLKINLRIKPDKQTQISTIELYLCIKKIINLIWRENLSKS